MSPCVEVLRHWSAVSAAVITAVHHSLQSVDLSQTVESAFITATFVNFECKLKNFHTEYYFLKRLLFAWLKIRTTVFFASKV